MLLRQRVRAKALEVRDELLALGHQAAFLEDSGRDTAVDALDKRDVLGSDLRVERDQLVDPVLVDARREEVVQPTVGSARPGRDERPAREVRMAREDVDPEVRPEEVELAVRQLAVREERSVSGAK